MFESCPDVVTVEQLMKMLGIGKSKAYELLQNRDIVSLKVGRKYLIPKKAIVDFITLSCDNGGSWITNSRQHVTKEVSTDGNR